MMKIFDVVEEGRAIEVSRTRAGRGLNAAIRFAATLPIVFVLLFGYFLVDVLGPREIDGERIVAYAASAGMLAVIFAVAIGLAGALRTSRWRIDLADRTIGYETRLAVGEPRGVTVDMENLEGVIVERRGIGRRSAVLFDFGEEREEVAATRLGPEPLSELVDALRRLLDGESIPFQDD